MSIRYKFGNLISALQYRHSEASKKGKPKSSKTVTKRQVNVNTDRPYDYREDQVRMLGGSKTYYIRLPNEKAKQEYFDYLIEKQKDWPYDYKRGQADSYYRSEYQRYVGKCPLCKDSIWGGGEHQYFKNTDGLFQHYYCDLPAVESKEEAIKRGFMDGDDNLLSTDGKIIGKLKPKLNQ